MNKLVSGLVKGVIVAAVGFIAGITIAEKNDRKEAKSLTVNAVDVEEEEVL